MTTYPADPDELSGFAIKRAGTYLYEKMRDSFITNLLEIREALGILCFRVLNLIHFRLFEHRLILQIIRCFQFLQRLQSLLDCLSDELRLLNLLICILVAERQSIG